MLPFLTESFGNPSSAHAYGRVARAALDDAHERVAARLNARRPRDRLHVRRHRGEQPRDQGRGLGRQGPRPPDRDLVGRASRRRPHPPLPREVRLRGRRAAGRSLRPGRPRPARGGAQRQDDPGLDHARQQRGRHDPADRRDRRPGADAQGPPAPRRRRPGGAVRRPRRRGPRRRPRVARGAQVRGAQGSRRAVRPPRDAHPRPAAGRHPGAPPAGGHGERRRCGRAGRRVRPVVRGAAGDRGATARAAGAPVRRRPGRARRRVDGASQGPPARAAVDRGPRHGRRVRRDVAGPRGHRLLGGFRVHDGLDRGQPRPVRDGLPGRGGARRAPPVARPDDDRRRDRRGVCRSCRG